MSENIRAPQMNDIVASPLITVSFRRSVTTPDIDLCEIKEGSGDTLEVFELLSGVPYLNAGDVTTFLSGAAGTFKRIWDQVGYADPAARQFSQFTPANEPTYVASGINGKVSARSGTDKVLASQFDFAITDTEATFFCVAHNDAGQTGNATLFTNTANMAIDDSFALTFDGNNVLLRITDSTGGTDNTSSYAITAAPHLFRVVCDGIDNIKLYVDNVLQESKTVGNGFLCPIGTPDLMEDFDGLFSELVAWDRILTSAEVIRVEADMNTFYGI